VAINWLLAGFLIVVSGFLLQILLFFSKHTSIIGSVATQ
jgi:hypothetical protein